MKQKTRFKIFGNIGIGLKKAMSVDLYVWRHSQKNQHPQPKHFIFECKLQDLPSLLSF